MADWPCWHAKIRNSNCANLAGGQRECHRPGQLNSARKSAITPRADQVEGGNSPAGSTKVAMRLETPICFQIVERTG